MLEALNTHDWLVIGLYVVAAVSIFFGKRFIATIDKLVAKVSEHGEDIANIKGRLGLLDRREPARQREYAE